MMGVDEGYILSDRAFAGADVLATSYTLSQGIRSIGSFDLIICGKQTTDGDTAQVGPAIAEYLDIPHVAWVSTINKVDNEKITVEQDLSESVESVELHYPCLITVEKDIVQPRLPSYKRKLETMTSLSKCLHFKIPIRMKTNTVLRVLLPGGKDISSESNTKEFCLKSPDELANKCYDTLKRLKFI